MKLPSMREELMVQIENAKAVFNKQREETEKVCDCEMDAIEVGRTAKKFARDLHYALLSTHGLTTEQREELETLQHRAEVLLDICNIVRKECFKRRFSENDE